MLNSVEIILVPTLMILVGYCLKRFNLLKSDDNTTLSAIVMNISLPSLIFINISKASISPDMLILPICCVFVSFIGMFFAVLYAKLRNYSKIKTWTIIIAIGLANTGFLGYPICLGLFGNEGLINAIFYDLSSAILLVVYGMLLVSVFGGNRREIIMNALGFMPLWAVLFALIVNVLSIDVGYVLTNVFTYLGDSTIPLIMLSLGLTIEFKDIRNYLSDISFVFAIRLVIMPILVLIAFSLLGVSGLIKNVSVLEAGMASAMNGVVLALTYGLDVDLMSSIVFATTLLSLITIPLLHTFLV